MPTSVTRDIAAPRARLWEVLADGWTYETVVLSCTPQEELVLLARVGPLGAARITLRLNDIPDRCRLEMAEVAVEGPIRFVPDRVQLAGVWPRNKECTWRLAYLAEHRDPDELE